MKFRTTLVFALILALFGTYVYFFEYKKSQETKQKEEEGKKVFRIDWEKLKGLKLVGTNGIFVIERSKVKKGAIEEEAWEIKAPMETDAEESTLNGLVSTLKDLKSEQVVAEDPKDLAVFGLSAPQIKVGVLVAEGTPPPLLLIGGKSPVGLNSYAMIEGEKRVLLLSADLGAQFDKKLFDLRDKRVFQFKREDVERLKVDKRGSTCFEAVKKGDQWQLLTPLKARASETELNKIVNKLIGLRADAFEDEAAKQVSSFGLDNPEWNIQFTLGPDHTVASLSLGRIYKKDATDYVYAMRRERPTVIALKEDLITAINKKPEDLREKKVFPFKSWEVQKVDVVIEGKAFTLAKDEKGKWNLTSPVTARANAGKVSSFISSLSQLEAVDFLSPPSSPEELAPYGLKEPKAAITLYEKEERKIGTLRLGKGKEEKEACYATDEAGDTIYRIKPEFMSKDLPAGIDDIREKRLMDVYRYQVAQIEALDAGKGVVLEKKGSIWKLKRPESRDLEEKEVSELLSLASDIEADSFVSQESKDLAAYGLSQPALTVTLKNDKGEDVGTLLISSKGPEGESTTCYAKEAKDTWIGVIKVDTRNKIQEKIASLGKNKG